MPVLIFADQADGQLKKSSHEVISYGAAIAEKLGTEAIALVLGKIDASALEQLGADGADKVWHAADENFDTNDAQLLTNAIAEAADKARAKVIVFSNNTTGKAVAPRLSAKLKAGLVAGATALPVLDNGFVVRKSVFSGKAFAHVKINTEVKIISLNGNAYGVIPFTKTASVETVSLSAGSPAVKLLETQKVTGSVPLAEAELVVSGGRGMKGPENWHLIEDLANALGAATACSRPVADAHWRPHHEHVGQTGGAIAPNLYIAVGISGAIQHLAGVNRSKTIVVINKDPEAPFFKAADYGIVGDAFDILPRLTEAARKLKH